MRSPITALLWEIAQRNRRALRLVIAVTAAGGLFNLIVPGSFRTALSSHDVWQAMNGLLFATSILLVFGLCNFTENNFGKDWTGFPYRLFTLPVSTGFLVTLPMAFGVVCVELVYAIWAKVIYPPGEIGDPLWFASLLAAFMVCFQAVIWCLAGFRFTRILVLGLIGPLFVLIGCLPFAGDLSESVWASKTFWGVSLTALSFIAFGIAWICVARQRCGGGHRRNWISALVDRISDILPRRRKAFGSAAAAQFWFEWRRSGFLLPLTVGTLLVLFIGPLSWFTRNDPEGTPWILMLTLAMPLVIAAPLGKGFSKPDLWSNNLGLPPFVAIRPLATGEIVAVKMKVAALAAAISWFLVLIFLSLWLPLWADLRSLSFVRIGLWMVYDHTVFPQYAIAALFLVAAMFVTWKFLVGGFWIGLSGNGKLFTGSTLVYAAAPALALIGLTVLGNQPRFRAWVHDRPNELLTVVEWLAALAVMAKFWIAAVTWRRITGSRVRNYLLAWMCATLCLVALAILLWAHGTLSLLLAELGFRPLDAVRLRNLLILAALLVIPFARLGLAPAALARNRHG